MQRGSFGCALGYFHTRIYSRCIKSWNSQNTSRSDPEPWVHNSHFIDDWSWNSRWKLAYGILYKDGLLCVTQCFWKSRLEAGHMVCFAFLSPVEHLLHLHGFFALPSVQRIMGIPASPHLRIIFTASYGAPCWINAGTAGPSRGPWSFLTVGNDPSWVKRA